MALGEYALSGFGSTRLQPVAGFRPNSNFETMLSAIPAANAVTEANFADRALGANERQIDRARQQENWEMVNDPSSEWNERERRREARSRALGFLANGVAGRSGSTGGLPAVPTMNDMLADHASFMEYRDRLAQIQGQARSGVTGATVSSIRSINAS